MYYNHVIMRTGICASLIARAQCRNVLLPRASCINCWKDGWCVRTVHLHHEFINDTRTMYAVFIIIDCMKKTIDITGHIKGNQFSLLGAVQNLGIQCKCVILSSHMLKGLPCQNKVSSSSSSLCSSCQSTAAVQCSKDKTRL